MRLRIAVVAVFVALFAVGSVAAQQAAPPAPAAVQPAPAKAPAVPVMDPLASKDLTIALLTAENARLAAEKAQADLNAMLARLAVPGFVIMRGQDGMFVYQPEPKPVEPKKEQ